MTAGFVNHELTYWHDVGAGAGFLEAGFPVQPGWPGEHPETKRRFRNLLELTPLWDQLHHIKPRAATDAEIMRFHTERYLNVVKELSKSPFGGDAGELARVGAGTYEIAAMASGMTISAVEAVMRGDCTSAYALTRPPGHHADADMGRGFCIFGNIVIAAKHCQAVHGMKRIAVVDYDVHHGNGTETAFYRDPSVLTISLHQDNMFPPDRGKVEHVGEGEGEGYCINIPMPPGSGSGAYDAAFKEVIVPALQRYKPEIIFVASGFDSSYYDPLGRMMLFSDDYRSISRQLMAVADEVCTGRLVFSHEGGYNPWYVPFCGVAVMEALCGSNNVIEDPYIGFPAAATYQSIQPHQRAVIDAVRQQTEKYWNSW
ncbi:class II histone deacetylase [Sandarakinorhabdus rubra]|uniref:class II histone deacetylase n=1 Tax=Sandarakinorhabdus rubra TaxID=2672568 RepID=UPI0013DA97EE|nr:class II histone deacetylase [Sandarakinorhabdus rubra]